MKQHVYAVASPVPEEGNLFGLMCTVENILKRGGIPFERPKLGRHITFIPPFRATEEEVCWLAAGLEVCQTFFYYGDNVALMSGDRLDFFRNEKDALVVRLRANPSIRDLVTRFRAWIPQKTEWLYPPENYSVNFHATVGEAVGLYDAIIDKGGVAYFFRELEFPYPVILQAPLLYRKGEQGWHPVRM
jgi:hypothetical protein